MPLEFLARTYRDEEAKMSDRLTAARTLMDYVHRKLPSKAEIETKDITEPKLSKEVLKGLSAKELDMLETLMSKMLVNK
jgi:BarA-like signal transduction histidine kinase